MQWKTNLPKSPELVYYLAKLTGLAPFTVKNNRFHPPSVLGKLYPVLFVAGYLLFGMITFITADQNAKKKFPLFVLLWNSIIRLSSLLSVAFTPIIFLLKYKKIVHLMNRLCDVSSELMILGINEDDGKSLKNIFLTTVMTNATLVTVYGILTVAETHWRVIASITLYINDLYGFNTVFIFIQTLVYIRRRFSLVNEKLYNILTPAPHRVRILVMSRNAPEEIVRRIEGLGDLQRIRKVKILHLELRDLVNRTTQIFAVPILLNSIRYCVQFVVTSYWIYYTSRNSHLFNVGSTFCSLLRIAIPILLLFVIGHASVITCEEGNFTRAVLFKTWIKFRPPELANEFLNFSHQLLQTPITVSAFGSVDLGYSFVCKIFSIAITYVIIMIQFGVPPPRA